MYSFLDSVESSYGSRDLYEVLGVDKQAGEAEIRRAYHRISLKVHPDRVESNEVDQATKKFQVLGKIYSVLSDKDKRALYDEDGTVEDSLCKQDRDWMEYWRLLFQKVTVQDIKKFEETYKGSAEEMDSLKSVYVEKEGSMDAILDEVLCATLEDEPRYRELIEEWICKEEVPSFPAFVGETKVKKKSRKRKLEAEAREAEKALKEMGSCSNGDDSLSALIKAKQKSRDENMDGFFHSLEEKYCTKKSKASNKKNSVSNSRSTVRSSKIKQGKK